MKKININENELFIPVINKLKNKPYILFNQNNLPNSKLATFYSLKRNFSDFNSKLLSKIDTHKRKKDKRLKLEDSLIIKNLLNKNIKNNSEININIKPKPNTTKANNSMYLGPRFNSNESISKKLTCYETELIDKLLNKRVVLNKPKLTKLKINEVNMGDNIRKKYYKINNNNNIYGKKQKNLGLKMKHLKFFAKFYKQRIKKFQNIKSFSTGKINKNLLDKPVYEIIEFGDNKEIYANKLIIEENDKYLNKNLDCHGLMKIPGNMYNYSSIGSSISSFKINSDIPLNQIKNKGINNKIDLNRLKLINLKGLEKMRINQYIGLDRSIIESHSKIKSNRENYKNYIELMSKIFNKQEEDVCKSDL